MLVFQLYVSKNTLTCGSLGKVVFMFKTVDFMTLLFSLGRFHWRRWDFSLKEKGDMSILGSKMFIEIERLESK